MKAYYIYMMTNKSRVVLYTGVTNDLERRVWEHQNGVSKGFTKKYRVTVLVYHETYNQIDDAITREQEIKSWRRSKKNALVETFESALDRSVGEVVWPLVRSLAALRRLGMTKV